MHRRSLYEAVKNGLKNTRKAEALSLVKNPIEEKRLTLHFNEFLRCWTARPGQEGSEFMCRPTKEQRLQTYLPSPDLRGCESNCWKWHRSMLVADPKSDPGKPNIEGGVLRI